MLELRNKAVWEHRMKNSTVVSQQSKPDLSCTLANVRSAKKDDVVLVQARVTKIRAADDRAEPKEWYTRSCKKCEKE